VAQKCRGAECGKRTLTGIPFTPVPCREETSQPATTYSETVPRRPPRNGRETEARMITVDGQFYFSNIVENAMVAAKLL
jgi:hypothetical protein